MTASADRAPGPGPAQGAGESAAGPRRRSAAVARIGALVLVLVAGAVGVLGAAAPAQAAGYRYWSYWQASGTTWTYATEGPAIARPPDGAVHGFRFAVSADSSDASKPRTAPDFAAVCGTTAAEPGTKRIALVIDPGTAADAPSGGRPPAPRTACARVHPGATAAEALARVAKPLRYDGNALLCAISGYPATGCGEQIASGSRNGEDATAKTTQDAAPDSAPDPAEASGDSDGGPSLGLVAGLGALAVLGAAAYGQSRRRSR
ncbi:SCO2322 family protein [Streptomyces sp. NPDC094448]|uniref:SCO2322 family protein n=1 Tax=Streptomyces sp. NPDC094448 TaxID=3366063 RepID=UPI00382E68E4